MSIDTKQSLWVMGAILVMILATYFVIASDKKSGNKIYQQDAQEQQAQQDMYYQDFVR